MATNCDDEWGRLAQIMLGKADWGGRHGRLGGCSSDDLRQAGLERLSTQADVPALRGYFRYCMPNAFCQVFNGWGFYDMSGINKMQENLVRPDHMFAVAHGPSGDILCLDILWLRWAIVESYVEPGLYDGNDVRVNTLVWLGHGPLGIFDYAGEDEDVACDLHKAALNGAEYEQLMRTLLPPRQRPIA